MRFKQAAIIISHSAFCGRHWTFAVCSKFKGNLCDLLAFTSASNHSAGPPFPSRPAPGLLSSTAFTGSVSATVLTASSFLNLTMYKVTSKWSYGFLLHHKALILPCQQLFSKYIQRNSSFTLLICLILVEEMLCSWVVPMSSDDAPHKQIQNISLSKCVGVRPAFGLWAMHHLFVFICLYLWLTLT